MSLNLDKLDIYADPYDTNWDYLHDMTKLLMRVLEEIIWTGSRIHADLWAVPDARSYKINAKDATKYFMERLNEKIMEL